MLVASLGGVIGHCDRVTGIGGLIVARVFISHAVVDKELVEEFVTLLQTGLDIRRDNIFCSSIEGTKCRPGKSFVEFIRGQLTGADYVIMVVTPAYYESPFCMCELGGSWLVAKDAFPLLVKPIGFDKLKGALYGAHCGKIDDESDLNQLHDCLKDVGIAKPSVARWEVRRDAFLKKLPELLDCLTKNTMIPAAEHDKLVKKYDAAQEEIKAQSKKVEELERTIEELKNAKDKDAVRKILRKGKNDEEQFKELTDAFRAATRDVRNCVVEAMFKTQDDESYAGPSRWNNDQLWEEIQESADRGLLILDGNVIKVKEGAPKLRKAYQALEGLREFLANANESFFDAFEEEHEFECSLANLDFWKECLGLY